MINSFKPFQSFSKKIINRQCSTMASLAQNVLVSIIKSMLC